MAIICIKAENKARIEIVGSISQWKDSALSFRKSVKDLIDAGINDAHIYINSVGGECFEANEIVNEIKKFSGNITGEGGALVASAATYIAIACKTFSLAENSQFMIHQPSGGVYGNVRDIENGLTLLKNITTVYHDAYAAKTTMTPADFKDKWEGGDWWMTAKEAKANGFADSIVGKVKIDKATAQMITACGYKGDLEITDTKIINEPIKNMDLKIVALTLGLPDSATEDQVTAKLAENKKKAEQTDALLAAEKTRKDAAISAALDAAIVAKKITADVRPDWQASFERDFAGTEKMLTALSAVVVPAPPVPGTKSPVATGNKTFEELQEENPELLATMQDEEPEKFDALFADYKKRNHIK